jgi:hypothetical protein
MPAIGIKHVDRDFVTLVFAQKPDQRPVGKPVDRLIAEQPGDAKARDRGVNRGFRRVDDQPGLDGRLVAIGKAPALGAVHA